MLLWAATDCDWRFFFLADFLFYLPLTPCVTFILFFFFFSKNRDDQFQAEYERSEQLKHWCETQASGLLRSAEADPKSITNGSAEGRQEPTRSTHRRIIYMLEMWTDSFIARVTFTKRRGPGRWSKHLEVETMWVQHMSKQDIPEVHKVASDENEADEACAQSSLGHDE